MKKILLTGIAGAALLVAPFAHAADLARPVYKAPPPPPPLPVFSWTGCYVNAGIKMHRLAGVKVHQRA
jgi:outer membrane immunogenic protein